jgi:serine/threonine protein kinase
MVSGSGHGKGADWWGLGVMAFELLAGYPPFYSGGESNDPMVTYSRIIAGSIEFPSHFSREAVSLLRKLLNPKPSKRLGVVQGGARLAKLHTWFRGFDWAALEGRTMTPPHVPVVKDARDASNFDAIDDREEEAVEAVDEDPSWELEF